MGTIQPVIVVYNTACSESTSVTALLRQGLCPLIIDNSTANYDNESFCSKNSIPYFSMGGNVGLSKAYNKALSLISNSTEFVMWMDDDTILPDNYVENVLNAINKGEDSDLLIPIVKSDNKSREILSPSIMKKSHTVRPSGLDELDDHTISAINSGLIVRRKIYDNYKYDEGLFLDCIDHDFIAWCYAHNLKLSILKEIVITQRFSGDEKTSRRNRLLRYKIFAKDYRYYRNKNHLSIVQTQLYLLKRFISVLL